MGHSRTVPVARWCATVLLGLWWIMKTKYPFMIVNRPDELSLPIGKLESSLKKQSKGLAKSLDAIPPALKEAIISSTIPAYGLKRHTRPSKDLSRGASLLDAATIDIVHKFSRQAEVATVGILDLGAWVAELPKLLHTMNLSQQRVAFLEIQTPVPVGLIKTEQPLIEWVELHSRRKLGRHEKADITRNMLADEFFYFAETVRKQYKLDMLIGLTSAMVAFMDEEGPAWNYYSVGVDAVSLVSTFDLRRYAAEAGRSYEAAVGMLVASQVFALRNDFDFHKKSCDCIFDFNENRDDIVNSIKAMRIGEECIRLFKSKGELEDAQALVAALSHMGVTRP